MLSEKIELNVPLSFEEDHTHGPREALVQLVEYGDYECSYCAQAHDIVQDLWQNFHTQLVYAFRHFPLTEMHPHAFNAAAAAEAASKQNKFWEMHNLLFLNQESLDRSHIEQIARDLELDLARFNREIDSRETLEKIYRHVESGVSSGVNGTPTFFLNGYRFEEDWLGGELASAIEMLLDRRTERGFSF
jgi:protein-disulfide isomerase